METLQRTANRGSISTGYDIDNSVKLESNNSEFFQKSNSSAGNRQTWTYITWIKITETGVNNYFLDAYNNSNTWFILGIASTGKVIFYDIIAGTDYGKQTNRLLRDTSAWYHVVFVSDTTNGTAGDRYRLYINGVRETSFATDYGDPPEDYNGNVNDAIQHNIGRRTDGTTYFNGYLAETILVDGTALDPDSFGEFDSDSGIWKPIEITDTSFTWGTNGLWLNYSNASSMGANSAGTGGYSVQNVNHSDQATDTPTNNFATFNVLRDYSTSSNFGFTEGATNVTRGTGAGWIVYFTTIAVNKGKWYAEFELERNEALQMMGNQPLEYTQEVMNTEWYLGSLANKNAGAAYYGSGDDVYYEGTYANSSASTAGDIISVAMDCDNNKVHFAVNGSWTNSSDPANNTNGFAMLDELQYFAMATQPANRVYKANFGGYTTISISSAANDANGYGTFEYAPPTGFYSLCTKNLAEEG